MATYDLQPEMSADGVTHKLTEQLRAKSHEFYAVNLANADMVGHTGSLPAAIKAIEAVDRSVGLVLVVV